MQPSAFASALLEEAPATWHYIQPDDLWFWWPKVEPMVGDLNRINALIRNGHERLAPDASETVALIEQLRPITAIRMPGSDEIELWAHADDIAATKQTPVTLAFKLPGHAQEAMPVTPAALPVAIEYPPPQFGEVALIGEGKEWTSALTLSAVGSEGLDLWRSMGERLKALAAPAEWWLYTPYIAACLDTGEYERERSELHSQLLATRGKEREEVRFVLRTLDAARKHAQALQAERAHRKASSDSEWLASWREIKGMAQQLATLYWQAFLTAKASQNSPVSPIDMGNLPGEIVDAEAEVMEGDDTAGDDAVSNPETPSDPEVALLQRIVNDNAPTLDSPNHSEDRAFRESVFSDKDWPAEERLYRFDASNDFAVYFGDPDHPLPLAEAKTQLMTIRDSTLVTLRIALGIWNLRKHNPSLISPTGRIPITYDEILAWQGRRKHSYVSGGKRITDGYRPEDREEVRDDLKLASMIYLKGDRTIYINGRQQKSHFEGRYIDVTFWDYPSLFSGEKPRLQGVTFVPGGWMDAYASANNIYLAEIDRRVFQLHKHHEQHALRLAFFLADEWRSHAYDTHHDYIFTMAELLARSVIRVDKRNLTNRLAPSIEKSLELLRARGIIGSYECLAPIDKSKPQWGNDWLASRWRILPPESLLQSYMAKGIAQPSASTQARLSPPKHRRGRTPKGG